MSALSQTFSLLGPFMIPLAIIVAAFSYLMTQHYQRKVFSKVEYHRKGPNAETYSCTELGNRIMFKPGGGEARLFGFGGNKALSTITVVNKAKPEIKVFGFRTIRLHHVLEGFGETVDIRDIKQLNPMMGGAIATSEAVMATSFEQMSKTIPKTKGDWMMHFVFLALGLGWGLVVAVVFHI